MWDAVEGHRAELSLGWYRSQQGQALGTCLGGDIGQMNGSDSH